MGRAMIALVILTGCSLGIAQELVAEQHGFQLYSAFWPNLHQTLMKAAWLSRTPTGRANLARDLSGDLAVDERAAWDSAVAFYTRDLMTPDFRAPYFRKVEDVLYSSDLKATDNDLTPEHRQALNRAAGVYRKYWWPAHDRANRLWIAEATDRVGQLIPEVPNRLAAFCGSEWPAPAIRVDLLFSTPGFGAFDAVDPTHAVVGSGDEHTRGWSGAEILLHWKAFWFTAPLSEQLLAESKRQAKEVNARVLSSMSLAYTTGEVVRQVLTARGTTYVPVFGRAPYWSDWWRENHERYEKAWAPCLSGQEKREAGVRRLVYETR